MRETPDCRLSKTTKVPPAVATASGATCAGAPRATAKDAAGNPPADTGAAKTSVSPRPGRQSVHNAAKPPPGKPAAATCVCWVLVGSTPKPPFGSSTTPAADTLAP